MTHSFQQKLCDILINNNIITEKEAADLHKNFKGKSKEAFQDFLVQEGFVTRDELLKALSQYYDVPSFNVVGYMFDHRLLVTFPQDFLLKHGIIALERDENMLVFVVSDPHNFDLIPELAEYVTDEVRFYVGLKEDIINAIMEFYEESPFQFDDNQLLDDDSGEIYEDDHFLEDIFKE